MKGRERPCSIRRRLRSSRNVLQRSVELATQSGHSSGHRRRLRSCARSPPSLFKTWTGLKDHGGFILPLSKLLMHIAARPERMDVLVECAGRGERTARAPGSGPALQKAKRFKLHPLSGYGLFKTLSRPSPSSVASVMSSYLSTPCSRSCDFSSSSVIISLRRFCGINLPSRMSVRL
jgi:hypothetical protein